MPTMVSRLERRQHPRGRPWSPRRIQRGFEGRTAFMHKRIQTLAYVAIFGFRHIQLMFMRRVRAAGRIRRTGLGKADRDVTVEGTEP
jgi:hypothetical protein